MDLKEIRAEIDTIDLQVRDLLMKRLDCSYKVAQAKQEAGSTDIYRADREQAMLDTLGAEVPAERRAQYLAVVRKITETSRMYQYSLIYDWNEGLFNTIAGSEFADRPSTLVKIRLTREDKPNAMSAIMSMIGDYGFDMEEIELVEPSAVSREKLPKHCPPMVTFDLTIRGDISSDHMRCLLFQLSKESVDFRIQEIR